MVVRARVVVRVRVKMRVRVRPCSSRWWLGPGLWLGFRLRLRLGSGLAQVDSGVLARGKSDTLRPPVAIRVRVRVRGG